MAETNFHVGGLSAVGQLAAIQCAGYGGVAFQITGTFVGTVIFEGSADGANFSALLVTPLDSITQTTTATGPGVWTAPIAGLIVTRARMSAHTSGTAYTTARGVVSSPSSSGFGGGGAGTAVTIADGADTAEGSTTDAKVTGDNAGTVSAKLRGLSYLLNLVTDIVNSRLNVYVQNATIAVTKSGTWLVDLISGQTGITGNAGTVAANTPRMTLASDDPAVSVLGATTGAAITTDADGTVQRYLRGLVKMAGTAGSFLVTATISAGSALIGTVKTQGPSGTLWTVHHVPAANAQATATQASAGGSNKNVCTGFTVTLAANTTAPAASIKLTVSLIDGASGGSTYLWRSNVTIPAVAGAICSFHSPQGMWLVGSAATAMTLEFSAGPGDANVFESVSMNGTTTT